MIIDFQLRLVLLTIAILLLGSSIIPVQTFTPPSQALRRLSSPETLANIGNYFEYKQKNVLVNDVTGVTVGPLYSFGGDYYGESGSSFVVKEFSAYEDLQDIVRLASQPLPERRDGIVTIAKYTSSTRKDCVATEGQYERLARDNPASLFLRCFEEFENSSILFGKADISVFPTYDIFYGGNRVARVEGNNILELEEVVKMYQLQNSDLDLFSEEADNKRRLAWGDGRINSNAAMETPKTTGRFIPGYDWDKKGGFFDDLGDKFQSQWDAINGNDDDDDYGNWVPSIQDK